MTTLIAGWDAKFAPMNRIEPSTRSCRTLTLRAGANLRSDVGVNGVTHCPMDAPIANKNSPNMTFA